MANKTISIGPKSNKFYQILVCLPKSMMELKDYCKVNPRGLTLSDEELAYAMSHGLQGLLEDGQAVLLDEHVQIAKDEAPVVVVEAPKPEPEKRAERVTTRKMREAVKPPSMPTAALDEAPATEVPSEPKTE